MGDWTSQNWTKRDGRNNQEEQQEEQEKKATYKTAAELAVKNIVAFICVLCKRFWQRMYLTALDWLRPDHLQEEFFNTQFSHPG
jgi:hypothetical protein